MHFLESVTPWIPEYGNTLSEGGMLFSVGAILFGLVCAFFAVGMFLDVDWKHLGEVASLVLSAGLAATLLIVFIPLSVRGFQENKANDESYLAWVKQYHLDLSDDQLRTLRSGEDLALGDGQRVYLDGSFGNGYLLYDGATSKPLTPKGS